MTAFILAHLSDPHLPMPPARLRELMSKRAIGYYNWRRKRHAIHRAEILKSLVDDIHAQAPGHIAITGDLTNISLPAEFAAARRWLETIGPPRDVSLVPGNHDAYVRGIHAHFPQLWADYSRGDNSATAEFPFVRRRGPLAVIGVSTAVPTAPFMASGLLGRAQREKLAQMLSELSRENLFRVLLIHHPLHTAPKRWTARLRDAPDLLALLKTHGVELVLHGHDHRHATVWFDGPSGKIPAIGVPSASAIARGHNEPAAYNLFSVTRDGNGWQCERTIRGVADAGSVSEISRERLI